MKLLFLKTIYKTILTALPILTYNSFTKNFFAPFKIEPYSTYINFKLDPSQVSFLTDYIKNYTENLELYPIRLSRFDLPSYFISVNIYNCSSPLFVNNLRNITRCEINTYVRDKVNNHYGTLILDYCSNYLSLDPIDFFKSSQHAKFWRIGGENESNRIQYNIQNEKIHFTMVMDTRHTRDQYRLSDNLIQFTDNIYYKNGICDKLYYDSSLVRSNAKIPAKFGDLAFKYKHMIFHKVHSIFYFQNPIYFICGIWHNIYNDLYGMGIEPCCSKIDKL